MTTPLLHVDGLSVEYHPLGGRPYRAVDRLSLEVPAGTIAGIVGESGSGKSTASLALLGLTRGSGRIVGGTVTLAGRELLSLGAAEWQSVRGAQIGLVTQQPRSSLNPVVRVGDQIAAVYRTHMGATKAAARERALELLRLVGINDPERRYSAFPDQLSGGMAQRVVIAMALSCGPRLLIADEPTSGLDVTVQAQILDDLVASARSLGTGLVLVTQDLAIVANYCDTVHLLHAGEVVERAPVHDFFANPSHPASLALLAAQRREIHGSMALDGPPVDVRARPSGCWLSQRCRFAEAEPNCRSVHPDLTPVGRDHDVRCLRVPAVRAAREEVSSHA